MRETLRQHLLESRARVFVPSLGGWIFSEMTVTANTESDPFGTVRLSPARARPPFGLWPSRTGLDLQTKACWRPPGSRACGFSACVGSQTTQDRQSPRVWHGCRVAFLLLGMKSAS